MSAKTTIAYIPSSHLDLFWLGNYNTTLERGAHVIKTYLDRCLQTPDETFFIETTIFADDFLQRYPDYRQPLLDLIAEGRVEIGAVWVDRWEHLTPAESLIRNIQFGIDWYTRFLGERPHLVTHPDLPSLLAQTSQIYAQAGLRYYVTSRKIFPDGAVWHHEAPDGSRLLYLNWPRHYMYFPMGPHDLPVADPGWVSQYINVDASLPMFPLGTIPVNGSAADLTDPETFRERFGDYLWNLVDRNREQYPGLDFTYTVPKAVLAPYLDVDDLPVRRGEIPSVWGVACDEEVAFFRRNRDLENTLLAAETMAVVAIHLGLDWFPDDVDTWQGHLYESAFYARKHPIDRAHALDALWRMQVFTEDHNGGGYEGALSTFQKRVIQDRASAYATSIVDTGLAAIASHLETASSGYLVFNPLGQAWSGPLHLPAHDGTWTSTCANVDDAPRRLTQDDPLPDGSPGVLVWLDDLPSVGYALLDAASMASSPDSPSIAIHRSDERLTLESSRFTLGIDLDTGAVSSFTDRATAAEWGHPDLFTLCSLRETGNDVTLRVDHAAPIVPSTTTSVEVVANGPLFTRVEIRRTLNDAAIVQSITLWEPTDRIDVTTRIRWWGEIDRQVRMALPAIGDAADIAYGTPFYGSGWMDAIADAAPRNSDELLADDFHAYREVQQWLHLRQPSAGLLLVTSHPGFHVGDDGLSAVLMRTSPSCGDPRLYWHNAGEQVYRFSILPADADWRAGNPFAVADRILRPPYASWVEATGTGALPATMSVLGIDAGSAVVSSIAPGVDPGSARVRLFEAVGSETRVSLSGPLVDGATIERVDLLDEPNGEMGTDGRSFDLAPWRIQTLRFCHDALPL